MSTTNNRVQLTGNLGNDPEVRTFEGGKKKARFRMATTDEYRSANGVQVKDVQWHSLVAWGKMADLAEKLLGKGMEIAVEGKLSNNSYTDKQGVKKFYTEVVISELKILNERSGKQEA